ncbi:MAG: DUF4118 domain-containing protein [Anaerolineae bacterium]|jgi:two-component system sensor histidine kinase KdpD|nr:DUF4118 domain-containing protein [Anaerolineae bacterium]
MQGDSLKKSIRSALLKRPQWPFLTVLIFSATLITGGFRAELTLANFTMIYLLIVVIIAIQLGTRAAIAVSFLSFLYINFFLTRPYYTFLVADPREVLDLFVFLIVAILSGQLSAQARAEASKAHQRAQEQVILFELTGQLNQSAEPNAVYQILDRVLRTDLNARAVFILPKERATFEHYQTLHYFLLQIEAEIYGTLCVVFDDPLSPEKQRLLQTCASQAAMALHRIALAERARKSHQFEESDRLKTAILHAVSHDLRTPITVIKTSAHNLQRLYDPQTQLEIAQTIESEADHLDKLVGNLLDLSRLRAGALQLNRQLNALEEVVGDVAARVWQLTHQERIQIDFPDDFPLLSFDYGLILQALSNIVENALRYEPPGGQIVIRAWIEGKSAHLAVINHGAAIEAQDLDHIMEPFYKGHRGHIGLGLPIAKGILEAHQGALTAENVAHGQGVQLILTLPFA